jgi:hypothetical protein
MQEPALPQALRNLELAVGRVPGLKFFDGRLAGAAGALSLAGIVKTARRVYSFPLTNERADSGLEKPAPPLCRLLRRAQLLEASGFSSVLGHRLY